MLRISQGQMSIEVIETAPLFDADRLIACMDCSGHVAAGADDALEIALAMNDVERRDPIGEVVDRTCGMIVGTVGQMSAGGIVCPT
jgi:hypothetical protein